MTPIDAKADVRRGRCGEALTGARRALPSLKDEAKGRMKRGSSSKVRMKTFDGFLAEFGPEKRSALEKLRKTIRAAVPGAEECISYGIPAFRLGGKFLVGLGAGADHCSFYPGSALDDFQDELKGYDTGKGTIRFPPSKPLPAALVKKLVRARIRKGGFADQSLRGAA